MKKIKMTLYIIIVLWVAVITQVFVNSVFNNNAKIIEAFAGTDSKVEDSAIQVIAYNGEKYLTEQDKKNMINYIAKAIKLNINENFEIKQSNNKSIISLNKQSRNAKINIEVVSIYQKKKNSTENKDYIIVKLNIYENMNSILKYKELIEKALKDLHVKDYQTTLQFTGSYDGKLILNEMNKISDGLINDLQAKIVNENREQNLFTIYAYTGLIDEYINSAGDKFNVNIAIDYDENTDKTVIYLATPIINTDY